MIGWQYNLPKKSFWLTSGHWTKIFCRKKIAWKCPGTQRSPSGTCLRLHSRSRNGQQPQTEEHLTATVLKDGLITMDYPTPVVKNYFIYSGWGGGGRNPVTMQKSLAEALTPNRKLFHINLLRSLLLLTWTPATTLQGNSLCCSSGEKDFDSKSVDHIWKGQNPTLFHLPAEDTSEMTSCGDKGEQSLFPGDRRMPVLSHGSLMLSLGYYTQCHCNNLLTSVMWY